MRATSALFTMAAALVWPTSSAACGRCAPLVRLDVFNAEFMGHLQVLTAPLAVMGLLAWLVSRFDLFD
jgi:hypothetical protein